MVRIQTTKQTGGKMENDKSDIAIIRVSNGGYQVDPPRYRVKYKTTDRISFDNMCDEDAMISLQALDAISVKAHSKNGLNIQTLKPGVYEYVVKLGNYFAFGNSSPIIIIEP
jgi:hypothetical protein